MRTKLLYCLMLLLPVSMLSAQTGDTLVFKDDSLVTNYKKLTTDYDRIHYLDWKINWTLTQYPHIGDSLAAVLIQVAEFSRQRELICDAYACLANEYLIYAGYRNNRAIGEKYAQKCLELSKASMLDKYTILSYIYLAIASRSRSENQKALEFNNLALSQSINYGNDSLTSVCYSAISDTWLSMNNKLATFQSDLSAREFADKSKDPYRIISTNMELARFYANIDELEKSKDLYYKTMALARDNQAWELVMVSQRSLGDIYAATDQKQLALSFYNQALKIADSVNRSGYKINIYFDILGYFLDYETAANALNYFNSEPEITSFLRGSGEAYNIDKIKGFYFAEKNQYDSADFYFDRVLKARGGKLNEENFNFYKYLAKMYAKRGMTDKQSFYLQRGLEISNSLGNIALKKEISILLDSFYLSNHNYEKAFAFYTQYHLYNDSLRRLSEQKDLLSLEIDNENKRKLKQEETAELARQRRNNIQYLGITAAIATVFMLLVLLGAFKISIPIIKALGFFAFIFLFEFIILLADNQIHEWTHGEPWKVMGLKIMLVAILFPLHHWLEDRVIHYLLTHNMIPKKVFRFSSARAKKTEEVSG